MPPEGWAPVPGWPGYEASTRGRVRSVDRRLADGRRAGTVLLKPVPDRDGYRHVTLSDGRRRRRVHVARLVLLAHAGPCPEGMEALHGNGRRWDNRLANLRWGTRPENRADRERHRAERGTRAGREGRGVTDGKDREVREIDGAASCPGNAVPGAGENRR